MKLAVFFFALFSVGCATASRLSVTTVPPWEARRIAEGWTLQSSRTDWLLPETFTRVCGPYVGVSRPDGSTELPEGVSFLMFATEPGIWTPMLKTNIWSVLDPKYKKEKWPVAEIMDFGERSARIVVIKSWGENYRTVDACLMQGRKTQSENK